ncbi:hypothetical protein ACFOG5_16300 [Pedobacter fastidiosus]|uniref:hypothetical protein n=1 Tax=Pedobacter fastidiosus TaxID=2765361 RepID=UPI00361CA334
MDECRFFFGSKESGTTVPDGILNIHFHNLLPLRHKEHKVGCKISGLLINKVLALWCSAQNSITLSDYSVTFFR